MIKAAAMSSLRNILRLRPKSYFAELLLHFVNFAAEICPTDYRSMMNASAIFQLPFLKLFPLMKVEVEKGFPVVAFNPPPPNRPPIKKGSKLHLFTETFSKPPELLIIGTCFCGFLLSAFSFSSLEWLHTFFTF